MNSPLLACIWMTAVAKNILNSVFLIFSELLTLSCTKYDDKYDDDCDNCFCELDEVLENDGDAIDDDEIGSIGVV